MRKYSRSNKARVRSSSASGSAVPLGSHATSLGRPRSIAEPLHHQTPLQAVGCVMLMATRQGSSCNAAGTARNLKIDAHRG